MFTRDFAQKPDRLTSSLDASCRPNKERLSLIAARLNEHVMNFLDRNTEANHLSGTHDEVFGVDFHVLPYLLTCLI